MNHSSPGEDSTVLVKVTVTLPADSWHSHGSETLWAAHVGGDRYELRNVPFFAKELSFGDVVAARHLGGRLVINGILRRNGHSTYRLILSDSFDELSFQKWFLPFAAQGCTFERADDRLIAIDVPPGSDVVRVYAELEKGEKLGRWDFEEGHYGHRDS